MRKCVAFGFLFLFLLSAGYAQSQSQKIKDDESVVILKNLQQKIQSFKSLKTNFSLETEKNGSTIDKIKGTFWIKGDKYKLVLPNQHIYCDSVNVWSYLPQQNEVSISLYEDEDEEFSINPLKLIANYSKHYKSAFIRETTEKGILIQVIDLYPLKSQSFFKVRLLIDKNKKQIWQISVYEKEGTIYHYSFDTFTPNFKMEGKLFVFDKNQFPKVEVIDMR